MHLSNKSSVTDPTVQPSLPTWFAGQLAVWEGLVPAALPGPTADVDALAGIRKKEEVPAGGTAGMADGVSVLEGADGTGAGDDEYDRADSFLADSGELLHSFPSPPASGSASPCPFMQSRMSKL